ncbi:AzlC family ABC transporter permease [Gottschalkiaceae bacterium SANA]|nr:AzlC family ABC transporter permease [Gottschalkiaceae bacterium SANA]
MEKCSRRDALNDGVPIIVGFIPIAMAFGILSKAAGISWIESLGFSMIVFAGASQFIALNLLLAGVGIGEIIITTLLVNFRHVLFSASLASKLPELGKRMAPLIAFGMTDEVFSVASLKEKELTLEYMIVLELCAYSAFAIGTFAGYLLGNVLPELVQMSMGIALYAMFIAILVPEMKKSKKVVSMLVLSGLLNTFFLRVCHLPQGWSIVSAIIIVSFAGLFIREGKVCCE